MLVIGANWGRTGGCAKLNDTIFLDTRSVTGKIKGGIYAEQGDSLATLTTDPGITTCRDALVPCRELSRRLSEEMPLGCGGHAPEGSALGVDGRERRECDCSVVSNRFN